MVEAELARLDSEFVSNTFASIMSLLLCAERLKRGDHKKMAKLILEDFITLTLPFEVSSLDLVPEQRYFPSAFAGGNCVDGCSGRCRHTRNAPDVQTSGQLLDLLGLLFASRRDCHVCRGWVCDIVVRTAEAIDARGLNRDFGSDSPEQFAMLRGAVRRRRLGEGVAAACAKAVADRRFRSSSRMAFAGNIDASPNALQSKDQQALVDYQFTLSSHVVQRPEINLSLDSKVIDGEDTTIYACWLSFVRIAGWLTPQAFCSRRCSHLVIPPLSSLMQAKRARRYAWARGVRATVAIEIPLCGGLAGANRITWQI